MEDFLKNLLLVSGCSLEESRVFGESGVDFWHCIVLRNDNFPLAGGFAQDRMQARKIALAEYLERKTYHSIIKADDATRIEWGINLIPTACGFAAGFDKKNTILRSIREAAERWVMSKWIDDGFWIEEISPERLVNTLDPASLFFISNFSEVRFFKKHILLEVNGMPLEIAVAQTMACTENGIFPGSSAQLTGGNIWQHALLESFRHYLFVKNSPVRENVFPDEKIRYFAKNKEVAIAQISKAKSLDWPSPKISFHKQESFLNNQYFVARTILPGWESWHLGSLDRFLY